VDLDNTQRRLHVDVARARVFYEQSWDAVVRGDLDAALDILEQAEQVLRTINNNKVVPIRGPKG
jgi:hypothetical protein